jgi:enamine deaminase RidA (YjgF/YER057c/UK114 family)
MKYSLILIVMLMQIVVVRAQSPEEKLAELGITLREPGEPVATYVNWRRVGNMLYIAGTADINVKGRVGKDLTVEEGYEAARLSGIQILSVIKSAIGDLSKIKQFVRVHGMVNSSPDFFDQPKVINGFSDLMFEVFGEKGLHARAAVGHSVLPFNVTVEIEVTVELEDGN